MNTGNPDNSTPERRTASPAPGRPAPRRPESAALLYYLRAARDLLIAAYREWRRDNAQTLGAALAFYTTLSLAPLLIVLIAVFGQVFGAANVRLELLAWLQEAISPQAARAVRMLIEAFYPPGAGATATAFAVAVILYGATKALVMLTQALNLMWGVKPTRRVNFRHLLKVRALALLMVLVLGFLLLLSLIISTGLVALGGLIEPLIPIPISLFRLIDFFISLVLVSLLFALIYKEMPDIKLAWRDVWVGSALTTVLFALGKFLLGLFFASRQTASPHGAATALLVILVWVYYCSQIILWGAEITKAYVRRARCPGQPVPPGAGKARRLG